MATRRPTTAPFKCTECGWTTAKWAGRCAECQQWGTVAEAGAPRSGPSFSRRPHLAFFLHDEVIVHTPMVHADAAALAIREAATSAGRLLFGGFPVDFPLDLRVRQIAGGS